VSALQRGVETWLGLLILGIAIGSWLRFPGCLINLFGFLFGASLLILIADFIYGSILSRMAWLRGVRFARPNLQAGVPRRLRWLGAGSFLGARRYRRKQRRKGAVLALLRQRGSELLTLLIIPVALGAAVWGLYVENKWISIGLVIGAPGIGVGAIARLQTLSQKLKRERLRYAAPQATEALAQDPRSPIVILRSFRSDGAEAEFIIDREVPRSFEEVVTKPLYLYGPVVAIGRPGEELPRLGAFREYVETDWQSRVRAWLDTAAIVVAILDDTPGLLWEISQVFDLKLHSRLLLLVPEGSTEELNVKWQAFCACIAQIDPLRGQTARALPLQGLLAVVLDADLSAEPIVANERFAQYYQDAVALGAWYISSPAKNRKSTIAAPTRCDDV